MIAACSGDFIYESLSAVLSKPGSHLLSHAVSSIVSSAGWVLTIVFGMGTGVAPKRIATEKFCVLLFFKNTHN